MAQTLYVEKTSFDENGICIFVRGQTNSYEVQYLPPNLRSKTLLSAYNKSLDILSGDSFDSIERATELLTPFELIKRSGHENDCRPTREMTLLFDYLYQPIILIQATAAPQDNLFGAISMGAIQRPSPSYSLSSEQISRLQSMRHFTTKDILLSYHRFNPAIVTVRGVECYFKQESRQLRRIENDKPWIYQQIASAIKEHKLTTNVCRPYGIVIDKIENASRMIGVLIEYIRHQGTLADVAQACKNERQLLNWGDDLNTIVHKMHEAGLVWGDAKPANVLVDHKNKLWLIDMDGSYTVPWVDADMKDRKEGDLQGLDRMKNWLTTLSEKLQKSGDA